VSKVSDEKRALGKQSVARVAASTETREAPRGPQRDHVADVLLRTPLDALGAPPRGQGATTENIWPYLKKEQRRHRGCIAG